MGLVSRKGTFNIVRHVTVSDETLKRIAEALGIPEHEHGRIRSISGEIHIDPAPEPASGGGSPPSQGAGTSPPAQGTGSPPTSPGTPRR